MSAVPAAFVQFGVELPCCSATHAARQCPVRVTRGGVDCGLLLEPLFRKPGLDTSPVRGRDRLREDSRRTGSRLPRPQSGRRAELIQVCANLQSAETVARELRALTATARKHLRAQRRLLVLDRNTAPRSVMPSMVRSKHLCLSSPRHPWRVGYATGGSIGSLRPTKPLGVHREFDRPCGARPPPRW